MTTYIEAAKQLREALSAADPGAAYAQLVQRSLGDLSELSEQEVLLLMREFAGNTCAISQALTQAQRGTAINAITPMRVRR